MNAPAQTHLASALGSIGALTQGVQQSIEQGDWARALETDVRRQQELAALCAQLEPRTCPPEVLALLRELVTSTDRLVGAVQHRRRALEREADTVLSARRAVAAYSPGPGAASAGWQP